MWAQACEDFRFCAQSFGEGSADLAPTKRASGGGNKGGNKPNSGGNNGGGDKGLSEEAAACLASVKKGLGALDTKVQACRHLLLQVSDLPPDRARYASNLRDDLQKIAKKTERPRKQLIEVKTGLQAESGKPAAESNSDALCQKGKDGLLLSNKVLQDPT